MPPDGSALGIDFGTSNTAAVVRAANGRSRTLLFDGSPLLPSAVFAERDGGLVVGRDAVFSARLDPARFEPNPKRRVDEGSVLLGDRELSVVELISAVLGRVSQEYARTVGEAQPRVTLTCPAVWGATRREVLAEAARAAGLGEVRLVVEPVAAATYFAQVLEKEVPIGSVVVVHDLGAGTFDASVVARTSSGFEVLAVDGRDDIGGVDVDEAIVEHLKETYAEQMPEQWARLANPSTVEDRRARLQLRDDVRAAKERLSRNPTADLLIPLADIEAHLTRPELETLAEPILAETVRVTEGVLRWANLAEGRIAGVFLVGGASRIPLMSTLLFRALGDAPVAIEQPELVVAEGSVLAGARTVGIQAPAAPGPTTGELPRIPSDAWGTAGPPTLSVPTAATPTVATSPAATPTEAASTAAASTAANPTVAVPAPAENGQTRGSDPTSPELWVGRVAVAGAQPPGRATQAPAVAPTRRFRPLPPPVDGTVAVDPWARENRPDRYARKMIRRQRRRRVWRVIRFIVITLLLIAVPVLAGTIAYSQVVGDGFLPDNLVPPDAIPDGLIPDNLIPDGLTFAGL